MKTVDKIVKDEEFKSVEEIANLRKFESKFQLRKAMDYLASDVISRNDLKKLNLSKIYSGIELYSNGDRFEFDSKYLEIFNKKHGSFNQ